MQALVLKYYGGPQATEIRDVPMRKPGLREGLVSMHAVGLNPTDINIRKGKVILQVGKDSGISDSSLRNLISGSRPIKQPLNTSKGREK